MGGVGRHAEAMTLFALEVPNLFLTAAPRASGKFIHVGRILSLAEKVFHNVCGVIEGRALSADYVSTVSASLSQCSLRIQGPFLLIRVSLGPRDQTSLLVAVG